ncbi:MAG: hypothetical protein K9I99_17535 [Melioribacteraceae bacterium]|nr:hypothetical protein [Melioribacteraceae bacterium]
MEKLKFLAYVLLLAIFFACGGDGSESGDGRSKEADVGEEGEDVARNVGKQEEISLRNLEIELEQRGGKMGPCDTLALRFHIRDNYPAGTYLVEENQSFTMSETQFSVIYEKEKDIQYIFALVAKSKDGERLIETKNVVGYSSSFVNLDSTRLGTAFFFLSLFECNGDGTFTLLWEYEVPMHGGFNSMKLKRWKPKKLPYIQLNFIDGIISGYRNYNYYLVDGIRNKPHLMETYEGIARKRTMTDVNKDSYPDFFEYRYQDTVTYVYELDSIPFYWDTTKSLYVTKFTSRWFRPY